MLTFPILLKPRDGYAAIVMGEVIAHVNIANLTINPSKAPSCSGVYDNIRLKCVNSHISTDGSRSSSNLSTILYI